MASSSASARAHIERIRSERYYIGRDEVNPLAEDMHQAVNYLSEELYAKDVHFLMELIQNAEDNEYPDGVVPSLEFVVTADDVTGTGAVATLLVFNNEKGFSPANVDSLCRVGKSTKKGNRHRGYIGEKGIGFKSVFLVTGRPYIFSNNYQICFNERPTSDCLIGYIVPEWVEKHPSPDDIKRIYGFKTVPTTVIILPLKSEKVASENDTMTEEECSYYMWKQKFPVKTENMVEKRRGIDEWTITLAFPFGERLNDGLRTSGVFAFLPTEMETDFPFIIQADFILASSRETILFDNKWNKGIIDHVPTAFVNALISLLKSTETAPMSCLTPMFRFIPVKICKIPLFEQLRLSIKEKLCKEHIMPCESDTSQRIFCKVNEVGRLMPGFWNILTKARDEGVSLKSLSSHGTYILNASLDTTEYNEVLKFLGVEYVNNDWYAKCIKSCSLAVIVTDQLYLDLLLFLADHWHDFEDTDLIGTPILKYADSNEKVCLSSIHASRDKKLRICLSSVDAHISWTIQWNKEFDFNYAQFFFVPANIQKALLNHSQASKIRSWLEDKVGLSVLSLYSYCCLLLEVVKSSKKHLVAFTHFLYHSLSKSYLTESEVKKLSENMPIVNNYGSVISNRTNVGLLLPAICSKWVGLMGSNPWRANEYVELCSDYIRAVSFGSIYSPNKILFDFLCTYLKASDVPEILPPNATFPTVNYSLTMDNAFLLLEWIRYIKYKKIGIPQNFLRCIQSGEWLKTTLGYRSPKNSFLSTGGLEILLQECSPLVDIPIIDQVFYDSRIHFYKNELKILGVMFEYGEACHYIGKRLMSIANESIMTRANVFLLLKLIRSLKKKYLSPKELVESVNKGKWLMTSRGYMCPVGSILSRSEWDSASSICNLPFIDTGYYGEDIKDYSIELELLGVIVGGFSGRHQDVVDNIVFPLAEMSMTANTVILILECVRFAKSTEKLLSELKNLKWLRTNLGIVYPSKAVLFDPKWMGLLDVFGSVPIIDEDYYGSRMVSYKEELKKLGVSVDYNDLYKIVFEAMKDLISSSSFTKENIYALLACQKNLSENHKDLHGDILSYMKKESWLQTKMGLRKPRDSILFDKEWSSISSISVLPFIDTAYYGMQIHDFKEELMSCGVVGEFKKGVKFVASGLTMPKNLCQVSSLSAIELLKCVTCMKTKQLTDFPKFLDEIGKKWLKTSMGFMSPTECILFNPKTWGCYLHLGDAPFIDEEFYGPEIVEYFEELNYLGVVIEPSKGCNIVASHLKDHSEVSVIARIYAYLSQQKWQPREGFEKLIWIPDETDNGEWVDAEDCILRDKHDLFTTRFYVLDKHYEKGALNLFVEAFKVKRGPNLEDYCDIWKEWEDTGHLLTDSECCIVWTQFSKKSSEKTELLLSSLRKVPANTKTGIIFAGIQDVFIPDDLMLKDLVDNASQEALFVWHPNKSSSLLPKSKLYETYTNLGVKLISKAVEKDDLCVSYDDKSVKMVKNDEVLKIGLFKILLAFLASPSLDVSFEKRQQYVKCLSKVTVFETEEPIIMHRTLRHSSGKCTKISATRAFHWDRENSKFFVQKAPSTVCQKKKIEHSTYFSEVISEGLLWEWEEVHQIAELADFLKLGFLLDFDTDAIDFLLKSKNLQPSFEDDEFLMSEFRSSMESA